MRMHQIKIRREGQITLPAGVRKDLELEEGDMLYLRKENGKYTLSAGESWVDLTRGALPLKHDPIEPDELEEIIEAAALVEKFEMMGASK